MRRVSSPTFVGRAEQLATFDESLAGAAAGKPSVLLASGESGVGKSRLVAEFAGRARAAGARALFGDCIGLGDGELPYAPIVGALRDLSREIGPDKLAERAGPSRGELGRLLPDAAGGEEPGGDEEFAQARLFELLVRLFGQLGQERPLVLIIEDLHWADRSTRDFLSFLSRAAHSERLVIVGTYRSDELHRRHPLRGFLAEIERLDSVARVELAPFSRVELTAQLSGILGHSPDPAVTEELFVRTEGNAFFVEELLAAGEDGARSVMPGTLRDALMVRVESLQTATQEVLRAVAASGRAVTHGLLADVSPSPEPALSQALREAVTNHVLVQKPDGQSYAFRHALAREAVYDDLLPGERGSLHVRLAEALEGTPSLAADSLGAEAELAWHWSQAHELPHALAASVAAAEKAEAMHAPAEAARHLENALELWDRVDDPQRVAGSGLSGLLRRAAEDFYLAGDSDRAVALARRAAALLDAETDPVGAGRLQERIGRYLWTSGRDRDAAGVYARAVELMPSQPPSAERALVLGSQAQVLMLNGRPRESADFAREAIDIARAVGDRAAEAHALNTLGVDMANLGASEEGIELLRDSLAIEEELGEDGVHRGYVNLSDTLDKAGRVEEAMEMALDGARRALKDGMGRGFASFLLAEAADRCTRLGRLTEADDLSRRALNYGPGGIAALLAHRVRAGVLVHLGRLDESRAHVAEAKQLMRRASSSVFIAPVYARLAEQAELDGSIDQVRRTTAEGRRLMEVGEQYAFYVRELYLTTLRAEADAAQRARAARDQKAEEAARRFGKELASGMRAAAAVAAADGSAPPQVLADLDVVAAEESRLEGRPHPDLWRTAAEANDRIGNRLAVAYAHMRGAEAAVESGGAREEAAASLRAAHEIASDCGAGPLRQACESLARRARIDLIGDEAPAPPETDPFGLTPREREVLELVAAGRTNRQIGVGLFMSEKTASVHVSRILAKLGVSTRGEAGAVAHKLGLDGA